MRTRMIRASILSVGLLLGFASAASAQYANPYASQTQRPAVSPYLNLLNRDQNGISNYFTQVRPQLEAYDQFRQTDKKIDSLEQQFRNVQAQAAARPNISSRTSPTGHPTRFFNYTHYYRLGSPFAH